MGSSRRVQRVERELRQIIATYLLTGIKDPLSGVVSVARVQASPDLKSAKVFVSMLASEEDLEENFATLQLRTPEIQREVGSKLKIKFCPKLKFYMDKGTQNAIKVQQILNKVLPPGSED